MKRIKEQKVYVCGDPLEHTSEDTSQETSDASQLIVRRCLLCTDDVEGVYYSAAGRVFLPGCCIYCGDFDNLLEDYDDYIMGLYERYSTVRPICNTCRNVKGLEAKVWGQKFFTKKAKK